MRNNRVPVSSIRTGCIPFNVKQKASLGYKVGENPVKVSGYFVATYEEALDHLRKMKVAGWRNYGQGNSQSAHKASGWVAYSDAAILLAERDDTKRVALYKSLTDLVD